MYTHPRCQVICSRPLPPFSVTAFPFVCQVPFDRQHLFFCLRTSPFSSSLVFLSPQEYGGPVTPSFPGPGPAGATACEVTFFPAHVTERGFFLRSFFPLPDYFVTSIPFPPLRQTLFVLPPRSPPPRHRSGNPLPYPFKLPIHGVSLSIQTNPNFGVSPIVDGHSVFFLKVSLSSSFQNGQQATAQPSPPATTTPLQHFPSLVPCWFFIGSSSGPLRLPFSPFSPDGSFSGTGPTVRPHNTFTFPPPPRPLKNGPPLRLFSCFCTETSTGYARPLFTFPLPPPCPQTPFNTLSSPVHTFPSHPSAVQGLCIPPQSIAPPHPHPLPPGQFPFFLSPPSPGGQAPSRDHLHIKTNSDFPPVGYPMPPPFSHPRPL